MTVVPVVAEWEQLEWSVVAPVGASRPGAGEGRWSSPLFLRSTELLPPSVAGGPWVTSFFSFSRIGHLTLHFQEMQHSILAIKSPFLS